MKKSYTGLIKYFKSVTYMEKSMNGISSTVDAANKDPFCPVITQTGDVTMVLFTHSLLVNMSIL